MKSKSKSNAKPNQAGIQKRKLNVKRGNNQRQGATIFDLQQQDKDKIGNLIRKVVELDTKCKSTKQRAKESQTKLKQQVTSLKSQNTQIIKQHTKLRSKFQKSLQMLQNYQMKLNEMDSLKSIQQESSKQKSENQAEQIQKEITDLKQLILDLHSKEQQIKNTKKSEKASHKESYTLRCAARHSMIYDHHQ